MGKRKRKERLLPKLNQSIEKTHVKGAPVFGAKIWIISILVAIVTLLIYLPALQNSFVLWDDQEYVYENTHIRHLNAKLFIWMFGFHTSNWHPLTWLSHALDYAIWGLNPLGHHLSSVILHSINAFLVCIFIMYLMLTVRLSRSPTPDTNKNFYTQVMITGGIAALLFGIHPLHVESVAWVAERKDVLSALFMLLSLILYVNYVITQHRIRYILCLSFFILALMSKPMAVTLPVILILLDIYPLQRFKFNESITTQKKIIVEKIPFFLLSALSTVLTITAQHTGGAVKTLELFPLADRILVAVRGFSFYLVKMIFPLSLSPYYPYPKNISLLSYEYFVPILLFFIVTIFCICAWKKGWKIFMGVWAYYVITLLPVIGIIQIGEQSAADRYTYIPSIFPFLLLGLGIAAVWKRAHKKVFVLFPIVLALVILGWLTMKQIMVWKDSVTLFTVTIEKFPDHAGAYFRRANAYADRGDHKKALKDSDRAIELKPDYTDAYIHRGIYSNALGQYQSAIQDLTKATELNPKNAVAYSNRAVVYLNLHDYQKGLKDLDKAIELNPRYESAYNNRAVVYLNLKDYERGLKDLHRAIELNPEFFAAHLNICKTYVLLNKYNEAIRACSKAVEIEPSGAESKRHRGEALVGSPQGGTAYAMAYYNRGIAYRNTGENGKAIQDFTQAISLNPEYLEAYIERGVIFGELGNFEKSIEDFSRVIELNPQHSVAYYNRGATYFRMGKENEAISDFQKAARLGDKKVQEILLRRGVRW